MVCRFIDENRPDGMPFHRRPPGRRSGIVENFPAPGARAPAPAARHRALLSSLFAIRDYRLPAGRAGSRTLSDNDGQRNRGLERRREKQREHDARVMPRIAALLELDGYPPPPPRPTWSHMAVQRIRTRHGLA